MACCIEKEVVVCMPWADGGPRPWLSSRLSYSVCSSVPHTHRASVREAGAASEAAERQDCCVQRVGRCECTALIREAWRVRLALLSCMHCCLHMPFTTIWHVRVGQDLS